MTATTARLTIRQFVTANMIKGSTDLHAEAERLAALIPDQDRDAYLIHALLPIVLEATGRNRRNAFDGVEADGRTTNIPHTVTDQRSRDAQFTPVDDGVRDTPPAYTADPGTPGFPVPAPRSESSRVTRLSDRWADLLNAVGLSAEGGQKRIGDMTAADLLANIEHRERLARSNRARAEDFRDLHRLLVAQGVQTVREIQVSR